MEWLLWLREAPLTYRIVALVGISGVLVLLLFGPYPRKRMRQVQIVTGTEGAFAERHWEDPEGKLQSIVYRIALDNREGSGMARVALILENCHVVGFDMPPNEFRPELPLRAMSATADSDGRYMVPDHSLFYFDIVRVLRTQVFTDAPTAITFPAYASASKNVKSFEYPGIQSPRDYKLFLRLETPDGPPKRFTLHLSSGWVPGVRRDAPTMRLASD